MRKEIKAAVAFISNMASKSPNIKNDQLTKFEIKLNELLHTKFFNHWHPEKPTKGQGYRCLRMNEISKKEPLIERAAKECGLNYKDLNLPLQLTIWVDPEEVSCRYGESYGSYQIIDSFKKSDDKENLEAVKITCKDRHVRKSFMKDPNETKTETQKILQVLKNRTNREPTSRYGMSTPPRKNNSPTHPPSPVLADQNGQFSNGMFYYNENISPYQSPHHSPPPPHVYKNNMWLVQQPNAPSISYASCTNTPNGSPNSRGYNRNHLKKWDDMSYYKNCSNQQYSVMVMV